MVTAPPWELKQGTWAAWRAKGRGASGAALGVGAGAGKGAQSRAPAVSIWGPRSVWINRVCAFLVEREFYSFSWLPWSPRPPHSGTESLVWLKPYKRMGFPKKGCLRHSDAQDSCLLPRSSPGGMGLGWLRQGAVTVCFCCSWKTTSTSLWTLKTSASHPLCRPVRGCWQPWRPSTARPPTTGPGTGMVLPESSWGAGHVRGGCCPLPACPPESSQETHSSHTFFPGVV